MHLLLLALVVSAPKGPLPPADAARAMTLPDGFKAALFAGEPDVVQPIAFTFDDRGRLWVVECLSYPKWTNDKEGTDRVLIFEDTDGDGRFDRKTVFWDKGRNLSGIAYGMGGVWLCSTPELIFIPADGDRPAGPPEVLLDGWSLECKHNVFNSLTWGPDGWLYGCNGITATSHVGRPGTPKDKRVPFNCGVWRYHPTRKVFEPFAWGTTNPFGLDFDDYGEAFITNCVIHHLWHVAPGAHFERMYGQDLNPNVYGLMASIAPYRHWAGGHWTESRGGKGAHSDAGGGHAHAGCAIVLNDDWPKEYRNTLLTCNLHGCRLNRDVLKRQGSGYVAERAADFLFANDEWFRGIAVHQGPDGLYVSDWCDTGECHNYEVVDRSNGRIFKVTYRDQKAWRGDLAKLVDAELVKLQASPNEWFVRRARVLLQERAVKGRLDAKTRDALWEAFDRAADEPQRLRALWALHAVGEFEANGFAKAFWHADRAKWGPAVTSWLVRLMTDVSEPPLKMLYEAARSAPAPVRLALASALQRLPLERRWELASDLLAYDNGGDAYLPLMLWYGVEPLAAAGPARAARLLAEAREPLVREYLARRLATLPGPEPFAPLLALLETAPAPVAEDVLGGALAALSGRRSVKQPAGWAAAYARVKASPSAEVRRRAALLAVTFDDEAAIAALRAAVLDAAGDPARRRAALAPLVFKQRPDLLPVLQGLLDDKALRGDAVRALAAFGDAKTPELILARYAALGADDKADAVATLASRPAYALALLDAVEKGAVPRRDVSTFTVRQLASLKNRDLDERIAKVWGTVRPASAERADLMKKYRAQLTPDALKAADPAKGRLVFKNTCAACHKLFDDGGDVGPELTGSQRGNLDYVLENVLDPSAVVANEYKLTLFTLKSGRVLSGYVRSENVRALVVQTEKQAVVVPKDEIDARTQTPLSLMPDGLLDKLTAEEARDLVAYLAGREQVPPPK